MTRLFANSDERIKRTNRYMCSGSFILNLILCVLLLVEKKILLDGSFIPALAYFIFTLAYGGYSIYTTYLKPTNPQRSKRVSIIEIVVSLLYMGTFISDSVVLLINYALVYTCILYYDKKLSVKVAIGVFGLFVFKTANVIILKTTADGGLSETIIGLICAFGLSFSIITVSSLLEMFNKDIFGSIEDKQEKEKDMFKNVLEISKSVREYSENSAEIIGRLESSSGEVLNAVKEIEQGTLSTCNSVENQTTVTQNIEDIIKTTAEKSKDMINVSNEAKEKVNEGVSLINTLREHSRVITDTNDL